jgi:hypothetical protein
LIGAMESPRWHGSERLGLVLVVSRRIVYITL